MGIALSFLMGIVPSSDSVFISHAGEDKGVALAVARLLHTHGLPCWLDILHCTERNEEAIFSAIDQSNVFVAVASKVFFTKKWPKKELGFCENLRKARQKKHIYLLRIDNMCRDDIPGTSAKGKVIEEITELFSKFFDIAISGDEKETIRAWLDEWDRRLSLDQKFTYEEMKAFATDRSYEVKTIAPEERLDEAMLQELIEQPDPSAGHIVETLTRMKNSLREYDWFDFQKENCASLTYGKSNAWQDTYARVGATKWIVDAMTSNPNNEKIQQVGSCVLSRLCRVRETSTLSHFSSNMALIRTLGGIDAIVNGMNQHSQSREVQYNGCMALLCLAWETKDNKERIAAVQGIGTVLKVMDEYEEDEGLQFVACWALYNLAKNDDSMARRIDELGGKTRLRAAGAKHEGRVGKEADCAVRLIDELLLRASGWGSNLLWV